MAGTPCSIARLDDCHIRDANSHVRARPFSHRSKRMEVRDSNGTVLKEGDNVTLIKDLKVKGTSETLKRGTMIKGIHLTDNEDEVECRHAKIKGLVLRTEFLKKA
jgi:protein PhnA